MSECHHCAKRDRISGVPDHGDCAECGFATCADPSGRVDDYFHGEQCGCGCKKFVCEFDIHDHSEEKHGESSPEPCFPALSGAGGSAAFGTAAAAYSANGRQSQPLLQDLRRKLNRFLNFITPGRRALLEGLGTDWSSPKGKVEKLRYRPEYLYVEFSTEFYSTEVLRRVLALSAKSLARALSQPGLPQRFESLGRSRQQFSRWAEGGPVPAEHALLAAARSGLIEYRFDYRRIRRVLEKEEVPLRPMRIADWLLRGVAEGEDYA